MTKRPFVPTFLQRFDNKLLRHKPATWATRTHLVIWFTLWFSVALAGCCYFAFFDSKQYYAIEGWISFVGIISFTGFIFWLMFLLRFNVFKRYGNWFAWDGIKGFILYFVCIGCMVSVCFIPSAVQTWRANQEFSNDEIVKDINELNKTICMLERDKLPTKWVKDSVCVIDTTIYDPVVSNESDTKLISPRYYNAKGIWYIDTADFRNRMNYEDSVIKSNDSVFIFFTCPNYIFTTYYNYDLKTSQEPINSATIFRYLVKNKVQPDTFVLLKQVNELKLKYSTNRHYSRSENEFTPHSSDKYDEAIIKKYRLRAVDDGISNIYDKKLDWVKNWEDYLRVFYYTTLMLSLLVFIFRHNTVKAFLITLLTGVLIFVVTGLIMAMHNANVEKLVSYFFIGYYILFCALSCCVVSTHVRKTLHAIGLNLFLLMTPLFPTICFIAYVYTKKGYHRDLPETYYGFLEKYVPIAELAGFIIFLLLLQPVFRKLYRKWYAAPED